MSIYRKFKSLGDTQNGYAFDSDAFDMKAPVNQHFRMYQTYGDGLTAHSPDWAITRESMGDYLASLATAMMTDEELLHRASYDIGCRPSVKDIEFAASVVYQKPKDGDKIWKRRYFSLHESKISSSENKRHDKRYEEVREFHDGSAKSIYSILIHQWPNGLEAYAYADAIHDWVSADYNNRPFMQLPALHLEWTQDRDVAQQLDNAYTACWSLVQAFQLRHTAKTALGNYKRRAGIPETESIEVPADEQ